MITSTPSLVVIESRLYRRRQPCFLSEDVHICYYMTEPRLSNLFYYYWPLKQHCTSNGVLLFVWRCSRFVDCDISTTFIKVHKTTKWIIRYGLMLLWFKDLMNATEKLQFIDPTCRHLSLVPSSGVIDWHWKWPHRQTSYNISISVFTTVNNHNRLIKLIANNYELVFVFLYFSSWRNYPEIQ